MSEQACKTPITDLLKDVPEDARQMYAHSATHHQNIPFGRLAKESLQEIQRLMFLLKSREAARAQYLEEKLAAEACLTEIRALPDEWDEWASETHKMGHKQTALAVAGKASILRAILEKHDAYLR